MKGSRLQSLISIDSQQSIFYYFYSRNKEALDGDFLSPKQARAYPGSPSTLGIDESQLESAVFNDKSSLRRSKTHEEYSDPSIGRQPRLESSI